MNGVDATPPGATTPSGVWTVPSTALIAKPGANDVTVEVELGGHRHYAQLGARESGGQCKPGGTNPASTTGRSRMVQRTFVAEDSNAGAVTLVRSGSTPFASGLPGLPYDNNGDGGVTVPIYPTVGIR